MVFHRFIGRPFGLWAIVAGLFARNFMIAIRFQTNLRADHMTAAYFVSRTAGSDSAPGRGVHFSE